MNVFKCGTRVGQGMRCVYQRIEVDEETGELFERGCIACKRDEYNIYPEFNLSSGDVIYQTPVLMGKNGRRIPSTDVDPVGRNLIWENITGQHQNGLSFDYRDFNPYDHPGYYIVEYPVPTRHGPLDPDSIADVFGGEHMSLVTPGWHEDKAYGRPNIERCQDGLYGHFDMASSMVVHRSMRSYTSDVLGWKNFTKFNEKTRPKVLYLMDANDEFIELYCKEKFEEPASAERMIAIMKAVRDGEYINLREAAINNGLEMVQANSLMQEISLKSKRTVYRGAVNLQKICELYEFVGRMGLDDEYVKLYRVNILNYLLNFETLQNTQLALENFGTNRRYWFVYLVLKKAYKRDKIIDPANLPPWVVSQLHDSKNRANMVRLQRKLYDLRSAPDQVLDTVAEAYSLRLSDPDRLFPSMERVETIIGSSYLRASDKKKAIFHNILRAGVKWNKTEVQSVWAKFTRFYGRHQPRNFWNYIDEMDDLDYEVLVSRIEGEGNPGLKKVCFANLVEARTNYRGQDNWEVEIPKLVSSTAAGAKHKAKFKQKKKYFWIALMRIGGLSQDRLFNLEMLSDDKIQNLIEREQFNDELAESYSAPSQEPLLDSDEFEQFSELDTTTGSSSPMVSRGGNEEDWVEGALLDG